jgi:tetratricopeptide (TPR) repeat protein
MVTVRENGVQTEMRADEAFLLQLTTKGLAGDGVVARAALDALENRPARSNTAKALQVIARVYCDAGDLRDAARTLQLATLLDAYRATARLALETWAVEAALARLGDRQLTLEEQEKVVAATRMPHKVRWPKWWTAAPG